MENVVLVIHLFLALAIIGLVMIQRSEGGGLGIGGGGGGMGRLASPRGTANLLTRTTAICGAAFFATSLLLGILAEYQSKSRHSVMDALNETPAKQESPAVPVEEKQEEPAKKGPAVPLAQ